MPEFTIIHFGLLGLAFAIGIAAGWRMRSDRCAKEKIAVNASWQDQLESQQSEHQSLTEQNKSLMEQISQYHDDLARHQQQEAGTKSALKEKNEKIFRLNRELTSWENRVPPLVERYLEKSKEAAALVEELQAAQTRLQDLEARAHSSDTQIQPVNVQSLPDGGAASNKPFDARPVDDTTEIIDQIENEILSTEEVTGHVYLEEDDVTKDLEVGVIFSDDEEEISSAVSTERDDLKMIKGIGRAIEKTLNDCGIHLFHQIAEISEYDIDRVAHQLKGFRSRIYREDWIGQARHLQNNKANKRF